MKVRAFVSTKLNQLNHHLSSFPQGNPRHAVEKLQQHKVKEILFTALPKTWQKHMTEQGYNYLDHSIPVCKMWWIYMNRDVKT